MGLATPFYHGHYSEKVKIIENSRKFSVAPIDHELFVSYGGESISRGRGSESRTDDLF
jgi:hypothetical protein